MKLNSKSKYGIQIITLLAKEGGKTISASRLEEMTKIPAKYIEQIMRRFSEGGLTSAKRGINGGYYLRKNANDITVADILKCTGDGFDFTDGICQEIYDSLNTINNKINAYISTVTLSNIIKTEKRVYLDHAATTPLDNRVLEKMIPYLTNVYGNANSLHFFGREAVKGLDEARDIVAKIINANFNEIYFTSGGTEGDNWVLKSVCRTEKSKGKHIIISKIEHPAMLSTAKQLEEDGYEVSYLNVDSKGIIDLEELKKLIRKDTILIGVMYANNEVGTIQPIKEVVNIAHKNNILCFTDAVQVTGVLKIDVKELGVDFMTFSSHKFYGPKGVGVLYVKSGVRLASFISGGHQERGKRGGTTNVAGIIGLSEALKIAYEDYEKNNAYVTMLRNRFIEGVQKELPFAKLNGAKDARLPANANFCFGTDETLIDNLDIEGISASNGSACSAGSVEPSHVLLAMGLTGEQAKGSVRFTFGKHNTIEDVDYTIAKLKEITSRGLKTVPLFKQIDKIENV